MFVYSQCSLEQSFSEAMSTSYQMVEMNSLAVVVKKKTKIWIVMDAQKLTPAK